MVLEVMGRGAGWIAVESAIAGGADLVLVPERSFRLADVLERLRRRHEDHGRNYSIAVIAEGARDEEGVLDPASGLTDQLGRPRLDGVGVLLAREIESRLGYPSRCTVLGYLQRSSAPVAADRILATRLADTAFDLLRIGTTGVMSAVVADEVRSVALDEARGGTRGVGSDEVRLADLFG